MLIELQDNIVIATYDQERRGLDSWERFFRQIWSSSTRNYGTNKLAERGSCFECCCRSRTRSKVPYGEGPCRSCRGCALRLPCLRLPYLGLPLQPLRGA